MLWYVHIIIVFTLANKELVYPTKESSFHLWLIFAKLKYIEDYFWPQSYLYPYVFEKGEWTGLQVENQLEKQKTKTDNKWRCVPSTNQSCLMFQNDLGMKWKVKNNEVIDKLARMWMIFKEWDN